MKSFCSLTVFSLLLVYILTAVPSEKEKSNTPSLKSKDLTIRDVGSIIDELDGVSIYYNGNISHTAGRNRTKDGYNLGLKWQCVEFVKRYYYEVFDHKMPNSYGHAKDFFDPVIGTGWNTERNMMQYTNGASRPPQKKDIVVFGPEENNPFGHIGIISNIENNEIELAQQNWGRTSRMTLPLVENNGKYLIEHPYIMGWLSLQSK